MESYDEIKFKWMRLSSVKLHNPITNIVIAEQISTGLLFEAFYIGYKCKF